MRKFRVYISWDEPRSESFLVEAADADAATDKALEENDEIGEDYCVGGIVDLGEVPEIPYVDPNQTSFSGLDGE